MERTLEIVVDASEAGGRLDAYLAERFTYLSRNRWQSEIAAGRVLIDGAAPRSSRKLKGGERIRYSPPDIDEPPVDLHFKVVFEDDDILLVDKPPNLPCHPAGAYFNNTLWAALRESRGDLSFVSRLDRETSGLVLLAKNQAAAAAFADPARKLIDSKLYLALVFGEFPETLDADGFLFERQAPTERQVRKKRFFAEKTPTGVEGEGARTIFRNVATFAEPESGETISLVEAELKTGRTHQIRATLCSLGFPLVGDKIYGPDETVFLRFIEDRSTADDIAALIMPSQALHSQRLIFMHPKTGEKLIFETPPPPFWPFPA